jgi:hypothetical protein
MGFAREDARLALEDRPCLNTTQRPPRRNAVAPQVINKSGIAEIFGAAGMSHLIHDSVTVIPPEARGRAALAASHGGVYAAYCAAKAGLKGVVLCDAGVGRERAGIGGLDYLERLGVPAATVSHRSARIGDGADCYARGLISFVNLSAAAVGVTPGITVRAALERLETVDAPPSPTPPAMQETRHELSETDGVRVFTLDSNALVTPEDVGHIMLTGSHGGLLGRRAATAVKYEVFAAVYNDAGFGMDDAGVSRLPALEARGIAGACVSAWSARIGDGQSTYRDGFVSAINVRAAACGAEIGITASELVSRLVAARIKELK